MVKMRRKVSSGLRGIKSVGPTCLVNGRTVTGLRFVDQFMVLMLKLCVCECVRVCAYVCVHVYACTQVIHGRFGVCLYKCMYVCVHVLVCMYVCVYACTCMCVYALVTLQVPVRCTRPHLCLSWHERADYLHVPGVHGYQGVCRTSSGPVQTVHYT